MNSPRTLNESPLFRRVRLQAYIRTLIQELGEAPALEIIASALEKELKYADFRSDLERSRADPDRVCE